MAIANPLTMERTGGILGIGQGTQYTYNPTEYNKMANYGGYSSQLGNSSREALLGMLSGKLSDSSQSLLDQQFSQNLAQTREGAYGMPLGAQKGLEMKGAVQNALSAAQLGEQQKNFAIQSALGYEQLGQSDMQYGYGQQMAQNQYQQNWEQNQREQMAQATASSKQGLNFGDILGAGVSSFLGNYVGTLGKNLAGGGASSNLLGS